MIDELEAVDPAQLADGETLLELHRQLTRLEAVTCRASAQFEAGGEWQQDRAASAGAWLAWKLQTSKSVMYRRLRAGRGFEEAPAAGEKWLRGEVTMEHFVRLVSAITPATREAFQRDERMLLDFAGRFSFGHFNRALSYWEMHADPDGAESKAEKQRHGRYFQLSKTFGDFFKGDFRLDPINGAIVAGELRRIDQELFEADWKDAKARLGRDPMKAELGRTATQRRADALVEMATRSASTLPGARRPEPLFTVISGGQRFREMLLQLADGTVVTPGSVVPWLVDGWIERIMFDGPSRVVDVGVRRRLFTGATRRAVLVRDGECYHETCDVPADDCEVDHVLRYRHGGLTVQANGRAACGFHNRDRERDADVSDGVDGIAVPPTDYSEGFSTYMVPGRLAPIPPEPVGFNPDVGDAVADLDAAAYPDGPDP